MGKIFPETMEKVWCRYSRICTGSTNLEVCRQIEMVQTVFVQMIRLFERAEYKLRVFPLNSLYFVEVWLKDDKINETQLCGLL